MNRISYQQSILPDNSWSVATRVMTSNAPRLSAASSPTQPALPELTADKRAPSAELLRGDALQIYFREIGQVDLLTRKEESALVKRVQHGDEEARELMIKANLRLVVKIARGFQGLGLPLLDLVSEGNIGLIKGVRRFEPDRGGKLSTYVSSWIKQSIERALANQSPVNRTLPRRRTLSNEGLLRSGYKSKIQSDDTKAKAGHQGPGGGRPSNCCRWDCGYSGEREGYGSCGASEGWRGDD